MQVSYDPKMRRNQILKAAVELAAELGYHKIRRFEVAKQAKVSSGLINFHFRTMEELKKSVMKYAIKNKNLKIIAQGIVLQDPQVLKLPDDVKQSAVKYLI